MTWASYAPVAKLIFTESELFHATQVTASFNAFNLRVVNSFVFFLLIAIDFLRKLVPLWNDATAQFSGTTTTMAA